MTEAELLTEPEQLEELAAEWDALAVARGAPTASPGWMLTWWRHARPRDAELRLVVMRDRGALAGVAPFYVRRWGRLADYRLLADSFSSSVGLLALPDREWELAEAAAITLAEATPRPDRVLLGPVAVASHWVAAMSECWPGRARPVPMRPERIVEAPTLSLRAGSYDTWLARRSSRFRSNLRRYQRRFADAGGSVRTSTAATLPDDVAAFIRLHRARWQGRGGSRLLALGDRLAPLLLDLASAWLDQGRFRLRLFELAGVPACADLWIATGGEVAGLNMGWDEAHRALALPRLAYVHAIEDAFRRGDCRLDMGRGRNELKLSFADGADAVAHVILLPAHGGLAASLPRTGLAVARKRAASALDGRLPVSRLEQLRAVRRRLPGRRA